MAIEEHERNIQEYKEDLEFNLTLLHESSAREAHAYHSDSDSKVEEI
jgi:hypothetical protein